MKSFLKNWTTIKERLSAARKILLLFDYDGTLTPIAAHPGLANLDPHMRRLLRRLAKKKKFIVGIVSGRLLQSVYEKVRLRVPGIFYAGNHGLEMKSGSTTTVSPLVKPHLPAIRALAALTARLAKKAPGAWVEDKTFTLSVHYRQCTPRDAKNLKIILLKALKPWSKKILLTTGKKVFEIRPPIQWNKGDAVRWIVEKYANRFPPLPLYFGDDKTDEDAFKALPDWGMGVYVGKGKNSAAQYRLTNVPAVARCLELLAQLP